MNSNSNLIEQKEQTTFKLKGSNFISNWLFLYIYPIAYSLYNSTNKIKFKLRHYESSIYNSNLIQLELDKISNLNDLNVLGLLFKCYGLNYLLIGLYKISWASFTWLGN